MRASKSKQFVLSGVLLLVINLVGLWILGKGAVQTTASFASADQGIAFNYPAHLYLLAREAEPGDTPLLAIVLIENTASNRAYLAGAVDAPTEAPPLITLDVYANSGIESAAAWIEVNTNWILIDKPRERIRINGREGLLFYWDGLYAGKSAVVVTPDRVYVLSVNWISAEDGLLADFDQLLETMELGVRR